MDYTRDLTHSDIVKFNSADLAGMSADALRSTIDQLDRVARALHADERGNVRHLSDAENDVFDRTISLRNDAERHLQIRTALNRGGRSMETAFGRGPEYMSRTESFADDAREVLRMSDDTVRDRALAALEQRGRALDSKQLDQVDGWLRSSLSASNPHLDGADLARRLLISESDAYRNAFTQIMTQSHPILTAEEADAVRAMQRLESRSMSEGTPSAGGYGVPVMIDPSIMLSSGAGATPIMAISRVVPTNTSVWKGVSSAAPTFSWDAEGAAVSDDSPTLAQPSITIYSTRGFLPYTIELGQDYPNFAGEMAALLAQGYVDIMAQTTATGTGSAQPFGVFTKLDATTTSEIVLTTNSQVGGFTAAEIFKVWNNLPERFRARATWLMSVSVESQIRSFATTTSGQASSYFTVDLTADGLSRINGRPVVITDYAPAYASITGHANFLTVGDFSNYVVAQRLGLTVEPVQTLLDTATGRPNGTRGFFAYARAGADVTVSNGLRLLNQT